MFALHGERVCHLDSPADSDRPLCHLSLSILRVPISLSFGLRLPLVHTTLTVEDAITGCHSENVRKALFHAHVIEFCNFDSLRFAWLCHYAN